MKQCNKCNLFLENTRFQFNQVLNKYAYSCKKCIRQQLKSRQKIFGSNAYWTNRKSKVKGNARKRGYNFTLTTQEFKNFYRHCGRCFYCKVKLKELASFNITIDRKDNNLGYTIDNCVVACRECNTLKAHYFSAKEMLLLGKVKYLFKKRDPTSRLYLKGWVKPLSIF